MNTIIGGQLEDDKEHKLFLIYSEGNWVEISDDSPYVIIGNSGHGKSSILNRVLDSDSTMKQALKAGYLSFDSTRLSSNDVDFPIDVALYEKNSFKIKENRYTEYDMKEMSQLRDSKLKQVLEELPEDWMKDSFDKIIKK